MNHHPAPWSSLLKGITILATVVCVGVGVSLFNREGVAGSLVGWGLLGLVLGALLFTVRGYRIADDGIRVQRLLWTTRIPLAGLVAVTADPQAMRDSFRVFGNGGFFSITGRFYNARLGAFRAFVTDPARAVVLRYAGRTVVVSPVSPEAFVADVERARGAIDPS